MKEMILSRKEDFVLLVLIDLANERKRRYMVKKGTVIIWFFDTEYETEDGDVAFIKPPYGLDGADYEAALESVIISFGVA